MGDTLPDCESVTAIGFNMGTDGAVGFGSLPNASSFSTFAKLLIGRGEAFVLGVDTADTGISWFCSVDVTKLISSLTSIFDAVWKRGRGEDVPSSKSTDIIETESTRTSSSSISLITSLRISFTCCLSPTSLSSSLVLSSTRVGGGNKCRTDSKGGSSLFSSLVESMKVKVTCPLLSCGGLMSSTSIFSSSLNDGGINKRGISVVCSASNASGGTLATISFLLVTTGVTSL
mmetsp:Transcript_3785/g.8076  ORF Transcript_3785/g.8076 Transcript_3785/m.8076 type:complete len:231 (+) Transcript_3785:1575-2267(+)